MRLIDLHPDGSQAPDDNAPSVTRAANFLFESLRVGPEETGMHYISQPYADRKRDLEDLAEFMRFTRELWNALNQCHLGQSATDGPPPSDDPQDSPCPA